MDHLDQVATLTRKLAVAKAKYDEAMRTRNDAIRAARADRHGPGVIGGAAQLTPEQVRRVASPKTPRTENVHGPHGRRIGMGAGCLMTTGACNCTRHRSNPRGGSMIYDITAVATCVVVLVFVLWDGHISKIESYILAVCCLILGATSWVVNFLQGTVFAAEWNAYAVAGVLAALVIWKGPAGTVKGYILMACCLVLGSTALVTGILPPLVNMGISAIGTLLSEGL